MVRVKQVNCQKRVVPAGFGTTAFRIRAIKSDADIASFASMAMKHSKYFQSNDILGLPETSDAAVFWISKFPNRKTYACFLEDGQCVGFCRFNPDTKLGNFAYAVDPQYQGQGIATSLLRYAAIQIRRIHGASKSFDILVHQGNKSSIKAAVACGFSTSHDATRQIQMRFGLVSEVRSFVFMEHATRLGSAKSMGL